MSRSAATGFASSPEARPELAAHAVTTALAPPDGAGPRLSLAMPDALDAAWLNIAQPRFGALATGDEHHAVSAVWNHGKWQVEGRCEAGLRGGQFDLAISRGMQAISGALEVTDVDGYELLLADAAPLHTLLSRLPVELRDADNLPLGLLFAATIDSGTGLERAVAEGRYTLVPILAVNAGAGTLTLGASLEPGTQIFWALRHRLSAETEPRRGVAQIQESHATPPEFALLFSCIGRGPYFFGGTDHDLAVLNQHHPGLPVLGGYCGGEIAPLTGGNAILSYSAVAALAYPNVQSES
ncbi:MAG: FIST C-terminal domain-containing protein [Sulfurisoma sp.]|nr:FIST C-terminal domain-containing protein [Sulfurisoma sp.]